MRNSNGEAMVVRRVQRFEDLAPVQTAPPRPSDMLILQVLAQQIVELNQRVSALAVSQPRSLVEDDAESDQLPQVSTQEIDRTRLRDMFD